MAYLTPKVENDPVHGLVMLLGREWEDWIYQLSVEDEYTDPEYCHQN